MTAPYVESWDAAVWPYIAINHPEHIACEGYWLNAGCVVCCCGVVLSHYWNVPVRGGTL